MKTRALLGALLAAVGFAGLAGAGNIPHIPQPTIPDCGAESSPPAFALTLACGDGNYGLTGMRWTNWGSATATGAGSARANDCTPYCAAGHFHTYPVTATASRLDTCLDGDQQYTLLVLHYAGKRPAGVGQTDTWRFPCDASGPGPAFTAKALGGRRLELTGSGWQRSAGCNPELILGYLAGTSGTSFAQTKLDKDDGFHVVWRAPRTGRLVVVASQLCGTSPLLNSLYKRAVAVTVR